MIPHSPQPHPEGWGGRVGGLNWLAHVGLTEVPLVPLEREDFLPLPAQDEQIEPLPDPREPTNSAYPHAHLNLLGVAVENEVSSSVGVDERNESINKYMPGAGASDNPDSTSTRDPRGAIRDNEDMPVPPTLTVEHADPGMDATQISSSYNDLEITINNRAITARFDRIQSLLEV